MKNKKRNTSGVPITKMQTSLHDQLCYLTICSSCSYLLQLCNHPSQIQAEIQCQACQAWRDGAQKQTFPAPCLLQKFIWNLSNKSNRKMFLKCNIVFKKKTDSLSFINSASGFKRYMSLSNRRQFPFSSPLAPDFCLLLEGLAGGAPPTVTQNEWSCDGRWDLCGFWCKLFLLCF